MEIVLNMKYIRNIKELHTVSSYWSSLLHYLTLITVNAYLYGLWVIHEGTCEMVDKDSKGRTWNTFTW